MSSDMHTETQLPEDVRPAIDPGSTVPRGMQIPTISNINQNFNAHSGVGNIINYNTNYNYGTSKPEVRGNAML